MISDAAIKLIVDSEISDEATYRKMYQHPTWPQGQSGVTIGIGYDCGYVSETELHYDWSGILPEDMISILQNKAVGHKGIEAQAVTHELYSSVIVPWDAAMSEFKHIEVPKWINRVAKIVPNTTALSPDSLGALVSLSYNRGTSYNLQGDRYREMRNIKALMASKRFSAIPEQFRSMARLWPNMKGLRIRRMKEADLFEKGLTADV